MNILLHQIWAERLATTLLHFVWQGIALAAIYGAALSLFGRAGARARYGIACATLLAMALAPAVTYFWLSGSPVSGSHALASAEISSRIADAAAAAGPPSLWQLSLPWILLAWFAGVAAFSIRLGGACLSAAKLRTAHHRPAPPEWQHTLDQLIGRMHISRPVRLLVSARVESPSVVGWLRPVILAPLASLSGISAEHLEALLAHELAHIRRHDYLVNVLQGIAESLLFYHPAVWWVSAQIRAEREHCCDDLAVKASGDVVTYARALAELESARPSRLKTALAANDGSLIRRIRRLLDPSAPAAHASAGSGTAWLVSVLMLLAIGGIAVRAAQEPAPQPAVVSLENVWTDTLKQGDLAIKVRGLGTLATAESGELRVAQSQITEVRPGQAVTIAFQGRQETIAGVVSEVGSLPSNGTVTVQFTTHGTLPTGVTIPAKIDGTVAIRTISNVVYVGRPIFGAANSRGTLFKLEPDGRTAIRVPVEFGASSVNQIQIRSGLQPGDKIILSDMSAYDKYDRVAVK